jgi:hypothetical protein
VLATDFRRLDIAEDLLPEHFRHKLHMEIFQFFITQRGAGWLRMCVDASKLLLVKDDTSCVAGKATGPVARLIRDHGIAFDDSHGDDRVELLAARIKRAAPPPIVAPPQEPPPLPPPRATARPPAASARPG